MNDETVLTQADIDAIKNSIENCRQNDTTKIWDEEELAPVKQKIKAHYRGLLGEKCCYCCKNTHGEFKLVLDIEHILPKAHYLPFALSPFNLSVACKRCNMNVKGEKTSFLKDPAAAHITPEDTDNYKIIHPNFDSYFDHLCYENTTRNDTKMIKYTVQNDSEKGKFTYQFFRLKELEVDTVNAAQGIKAKPMKFSDLLKKETIDEIEQLLSKLKNN
ncbi:HNH endonuclease family protein [Pararcticibacter amylolyticus]|uniref:HNH endonuclease n=1 Tax=Pararcticibacter amylolyticus TaxID=2173175 RepID=A0A2U2PMH1_9SPHI|nr:HNH endonuclease [Pararcticibacter amylolyticus]PWG82597.1 HNH endonuclease [Pararcticibacter amylolyticus]